MQVSCSYFTTVGYEDNYVIMIVVAKRSSTSIKVANHMSSWKRIAVVGTMTLGLATGCSSGGGDEKNIATASPTVSSVVTAPFDATVSLSDFSATCREVACWLPTQWAPKLVQGETVSLRDKWPMDGMTVHIVCQTTGEMYRDQTGQETDAWYGILVPSDKLEPLRPGEGPKALPKNDGWIGYVGAAWIKGGFDKQAPAC